MTFVLFARSPPRMSRLDRFCTTSKLLCVTDSANWPADPHSEHAQQQTKFLRHLFDSVLSVLTSLCNAHILVNSLNTALRRRPLSRCLPVLVLRQLFLNHVMDRLNHFGRIKGGQRRAGFLQNVWHLSDHFLSGGKCFFRRFLC